MPNPRYLAGRAFEYKRKKYYESLGTTVLRTAGSQGPFDLIVIFPGSHVRLVQCKRCKTEAQATRINNKFIENPPIKYGPYTQVIDIYVTDTKNVSSGVYGPSEFWSLGDEG